MHGISVLYLAILFFLAEGQCSKLDGHHHHHGHHDHHHDHHNDHSTNDKNHRDFVLNEDIFARALAAEVQNGLFSPLPERTSNQRFTTEPPSSRGSTKFRMPTTLFSNSSPVTQRTTPINSQKTTSSDSRRTSHVSQKTTQAFQKSVLRVENNQEILTPITSLASPAHTQKSGNSLRNAKNAIKQNTFPAETTTEINDPTGFAPRAPPKTAKQFDPFSPNANAAKQQLAKFQIRPKNPAPDTSGFAPRTPPPHAKKFNPVPAKKSGFEFKKSQSSPSVAKEIKGFVPVSPPPTAPQFNPVPGTSNTAVFNLFTTVGFKTNEFTTFAPFDLTDPSYDTDYESNFDSTADYDYTDQNSVGKALLDTRSSFSATTANSVLETEDYPTNLDLNVGVPLPTANVGLDNNRVNTQSQINVLGALSSSGNILNSPKYNINHENHVPDDTHSTRHVSTSSRVEQTTVPAFDTTSRPISSAQRTNRVNNSGTAVSGPSAPAASQGLNGRSSITEQLTQFARGSNTVVQTNPPASDVSLPIEGRANFEIGVPLPAISDTGIALQQLDNRLLPSRNDLAVGRQLGPQAGFNPFDGEYPEYASVPATSFRCENQRYSGYFADPETQCQVFHICLNSRNLGSFLCPNGTLFHQQFFVCDWWYNVRCEEAVSSYDLNSLIGDQDNPEAGGIFGTQLRNVDNTRRRTLDDVDEDDYDRDTDDDLALLNNDTHENE